jgi:predicted dinucleotide-binding enzyme
LIANRRGPETIQPLVKELGATVKAATLEDALDADMVFLAIPSRWRNSRASATTGAASWCCTISSNIR